MSIKTIVVGDNESSMVVLCPRTDDDGPGLRLPIRIGVVEAASIGMGVDGTAHKRPLTHDLLRNAIATLGATVAGVSIVGVTGTTFYARIRLVGKDGEVSEIDARPSDAIALAVRCRAPLYAEQSVLDTAALPDFDAVREDEERQELERFHDFVEGLSPEDFLGDME